MGLVTPFDSDFWSTEENPKKKPAAPALQPTPEQATAAADQAFWNDQKAVWDPKSGTYTYVPLLGSELMDNQLKRSQQQHPAPTNPNPDTNTILDGIDPNLLTGRSPIAPPPKPLAAPSTRAGFTNELSAVTASRPAVTGRPLPTSPYSDVGGGGVDTSRLAASVGPAGQPSGTPQAPGAPAPDIDRARIDQILGGLGGYQNDLYAMSQDNTGQSAAEAQLMKADQLAKIRARDELAANQAGALGAARSARNRGDRALLERQAVGEQAYLGSQSQRQDTLRQAELEGNLAILRATEEDADRKFRFEALSKASDLGLNTAALEVDIAKADLASANNWVNNEAQKALQQGQLDERQYEALLNYTQNNTAQLLGFTRDMAAIQFQYDQLSTQDQNQADQLLMTKYGIDAQTMVALKQIKEAGKFKWDDFLAKIIGGGVTGATGAIVGSVIGGGGGGGASEPVDTLHSY